MARTMGPCERTPSSVVRRLLDRLGLCCETNREIASDRHCTPQWKAHCGLATGAFAQSSPVDHAAAIGSGLADYTTILVDPEHSSDKLIESIWFATRKQCASDLILLPFLDCESHLYRLAMEHDGLVTHKEDLCAAARLSREVNWESFAASLGTLSGRKAGALRRRLERQGKVDVRVLGPEDGDNNVCMIDWMLASKRDWAERVDKKGQWLYSSIYRDYLIALANQKNKGDEEACARILVLSMNDAPIAVCMVGMGKQSLLGIMNSFDRQHAKLAPGAIAMEAWVRWAIEHGSDFDLGVGSETFKPYRRKGNISRVSSIEIAHSAWGRVAYAMRDGASRLSAIRADMRRGKVAAGPAKTHHAHGTASNANPGESDERPDEAYRRSAPGRSESHRHVKPRSGTTAWR